MRFFRVTASALALSGAVCAFFSSVSFADTLSAVGGLGFGRDSGMNDLKSSNPLLGAEYSLDFPSSRFQLGGFFDYNVVTDPGDHPGAVQFMGALLRYQLGEDSQVAPFVDGKLGMGKRTETETEQDSGLRFCYGAGAGIRFPISKKVALSPRVDVQYVPDAPTPGAGHSALMDVGMMVSFKL